MKKVLTTALRDVANEGLASEVANLIKTLSTCDTAQLLVGATAAATMPVLIPAVVLCGAQLLLRRDERADAAKFDRHCAEVIAKLGQLDDNVDRIADDLSSIVERRTWVWARMSGADQAVFADRVWREVERGLIKLDLDSADRLEALRVYAETVLHRLDQVIDTQAEHSEQFRLTQEKLDTIILNQQRQLQANPDAAPTLSDADRAILDEVKRHGDAIQRATAAALEREFDEADRLLDSIDERALTEQPFRYYTARGNRWYFAGEFDKAVDPYEMALRLRPDDFTARNNATVAHTQARLGDLTAHSERANDIATDTLDLLPPGSPDWAMTQNNLGVAWRGMPTGDRPANLRRAIGAYEVALTPRTRAAAPAVWAATQNNLGNALADLPTGDRAGNLRRAIKAYEAALAVYTRAAAPADWAMTQYNLGTAWRGMPTGDRPANLRRAIVAYEAALTVRTRATAPAEWAKTQNNLGTAWQQMPTGDRPANLRRAIVAYEATLTVYTRAAAPADWAMTQNNFGVALAALAEQPGEDCCGRLRQAIACKKAALLVRTIKTFPREHAYTMHNLAIDRQAYEAAGCAADVPFEDIAPAG